MKEILKKRIKERGEERERNKRDLESLRDRRQAVDHAEQTYRHSFWCQKCGRDFEATGYKRVVGEGVDLRAWYIGFCPKKHACYRYITDKGRDVYYVQSDMIKHQRLKNYLDTLMPADDLFRLVYPKQYERLYKER